MDHAVATLASHGRLVDYEPGVVESLSRNIELYAPLTGIHHRVADRSLWDVAAAAAAAG